MATGKIKLEADADTTRAQREFYNLGKAIERPRDDLGRFIKVADNSGEVLRKLQGEADKTTSAIDDFAKKGVGVAVTALAAFAVGAGALTFKVGQVAGQFESLKASLSTVTGSAKAADSAFNLLRNFAATTPFQLQEVTQAFIKMKAMGLDSSQAALRSYGNTASAMGKSLNDMIEAVADAATGEFERLKEFGIKASTEGNKVKFTFQGVTTTVNKNSVEITNYLKRIGEVNFASAMDKQSTTLNGILSNLQDSVDGLFYRIGQNGLLDALKRLGGEMVSLTGESGDLEEALGKTLTRMVDGITEWVSQNKQLIAQDLPKMIETIADATLGLVDATYKVGRAWAGVASEVGNVIDTLSNQTTGELLGLEKREKIKGGLLDFRLWESVSAEEMEARNKAIRANVALAENQAAQAEAALAVQEAQNNANDILKARKGMKGKKQKKKNPWDNQERAKFTEEMRLEMEGGKENVARGEKDQMEAIARERELEQFRQQVLLEEKLRGIEMQKAAGVDELTVIDLELEAKRSALEQEIAYYEQFENQELEIAQRREQIKQLNHDAEISRIEARRERQKAAAEAVAKAEAIAAKQRERNNQIVSNSFTAAAQVIGQAQGLITEDSKKANKARAALEAVNLGITATKLGIEAAADMATIVGIPMGIAKLAGAAIALAGIPIVIAAGNKSGPSGGGSSITPSMPSGSSMSPTGPGTGGGGGNRSPFAPPVSRNNVPGGAPPPSSSASGQNSPNKVEVIVSLDDTAEAWGIKAQQANTRATRVAGRIR